MEFEWDNKKASKNLKKHEITFQEAASVFLDPLALTFNDPDHSTGEHRLLTFEHRLLTFGLTKTEALVIVSHTEAGGTIRIISARPMNKSERKIYEEG